MWAPKVSSVAKIIELPRAVDGRRRRTTAEPRAFRRTEHRVAAAISVESYACVPPTKTKIGTRRTLADNHEYLTCPSAMSLSRTCELTKNTPSAKRAFVPLTPRYELNAIWTGSPGMGYARRVRRSDGQEKTRRTAGGVDAAGPSQKGLARAHSPRPLVAKVPPVRFPAVSCSPTHFPVSRCRIGRVLTTGKGIVEVVPRVQGQANLFEVVRANQSICRRPHTLDRRNAQRDEN